MNNNIFLTLSLNKTESGLICHELSEAYIQLKTRLPVT